MAIGKDNPAGERAGIRELDSREWPWSVRRRGIYREEEGEVRMATTEELIDQLGGGGPVGMAIAAVVLAPAFFPPVRRSLRGLAKAAIVGYLRVTSPRAS